MTDPILRILIIDDHAGRDIDGAEIKAGLRAAGVEADIAAEEMLEIAEQAIDYWAEQGQKVNILSCDDLDMTRPRGRRDNHVGQDNLERLLRYISENYGEAFMPDRFFIHSAQPDGCETSFGAAAGYSRFEFIDIANYGAHLADDQGKQNLTQFGRTTILREYLNAVWHTNFPLSQQEMALRENPDQPLDFDQCSALLYDGDRPKADILARLDTTAADAFRNRESIKFDDACRSFNIPKFEDGIPGIIAGRLAFDAAGIRQLRAENPAEKIILALSQADDLHLLGQVDGVIVLKNDILAQHFKIIAENHGLPVAIGEDYGSGEIRDNTLLWHSVRQDDPDKVFSFGADVTLEIQAVNRGGRDGFAGHLYAGKLQIRKTDRLTEIQPLLDFAKAQCRHLGRTSINANADTAAQIADALAKGADGIGLVRTEHIFYAPRHKALLQEALQSGSGRALEALRVLQVEDFIALLKAAPPDFPLTVRLMDPPPEEFLDADGRVALSARIGPGDWRGAALALQTPGLYEMQLSALIEAVEKTGCKAPLTIIAPAIVDADQTQMIKQMVAAAADGRPVKFGVMIETLAAVDNRLTILPLCDHICFGTNDLVSDLLGGVRRNDIAGIEAWMTASRHKGKSPFLSLPGAAKMHIADVMDTVRALGLRDKISATACGHQLCGDRESLRFAAAQGLNVSVPAGYLAYAQLVVAQVIQERAKMAAALPQPPLPRPS